MNRRSDTGLTLVELIVAAGIGLLVLAMVGGFMVSSVLTQQQVTRTAQATSDAQLTVMQLESALRLSSHVHVVDNSTTASQVLVARVSDGPGGGDWHCEAWYYDAEVGVILHTSYAGQDDWPWGSSILNWVDLGSGLTGVVDLGEILGDRLDWLFGGDDTPAQWTVMSIGISDATGVAGAAEPVFATTDSRTATVQFAVESADSTPAMLRTSISGRQNAGTENPRCY